MHKFFVLSLMTLSLAACSTTKEQKAAAPAASATEATASAANAAPEKKTAADSVAAALVESTKHVEAAAHHREAGPVPADKSFGWLQNGNTRFVKGAFRKDGASANDRKRLSVGQKPHAIVLSCSDSRVPPEVVFDQKLGELFVVRTAGEALDNNVIASIEYAVEHLGSNLIVVMGHESCGAVKAALSSLAGSDLGTPSLNALANDLKPRLESFATKVPSKGHLDESWSNVSGVAKDLLERSALLRGAVGSGEVKIKKAMYYLESGTVEWR